MYERAHARFLRMANQRVVNLFDKDRYRFGTSGFAILEFRGLHPCSRSDRLYNTLWSVLTGYLGSTKFPLAIFYPQRVYDGEGKEIRALGLPIANELRQFHPRITHVNLGVLSLCGGVTLVAVQLTQIVLRFTHFLSLPDQEPDKTWEGSSKVWAC